MLFESLSVTCVIAAWFFVGRTYGSIGREIREARRETSRFPMFAARDELLDVVLRGSMAETDVAWRNLYRGVNSALGLHRKLDALSRVRLILRRNAEIRKNPQLHAALAEMGRIEDEAARAHPDFAQARDHVVVAFDHLVRRRTTVWHQTALLALYIRAKFLLIALEAGIAVARGVLRSLRTPTSADLKLCLDP